MSLTQAQWDRVQELYARAIELPEKDQQALLQNECADDPAVREELEKLLAQEATRFPEREDFLAGALDGPTPDRIEGYTLVRAVGKGGMGVVYQAEQHHPVQRTVAIKLIKLGMDTHELVTRFHAERQALALMGHPTIASVYDAGASEDGRPYFVMEFVDGIPLASYCDEHRLTTRQRLELFVQICDGIQHAHQKGIIHRDIKPSNVLVTQGDDGTPLPKIIDFGIAKATDAKATMLTEVGQVIGTLAYMSPEQASMTGSDIDTRTDVYSLGVLLYQLLIGALPFQYGENQAFTEILQAIREQEPLRPSVRLQRMGDTSTDMAGHRRTDTRSLTRLLSGDLDWIVMKALEKEQDRRYASASELSADVSRYLENRPVTARPPSTAYWARKFVMRHKVGVGAVAAVFVALVVGIVGTTVNMFRAQAAENRAEAEAKTSNSALDYIVTIFEKADPERSTGGPVTLREMLDSRSSKIEADLEDEPGARSRVMVAMAQAYRGIGDYPEARRFFGLALPLLRSAYGDDSEHVFRCLNEMGILANEAQDFEAASEYFEEALAIVGRTQEADSKDTLKTLKNLADAYKQLGRLEDARRHLEHTIEIRERTDPDGTRLARTYGSLADVHSRLGDHDEAIALANRSLEIRRNRENPKPAIIGFGYLILGDVYLLFGAYVEALDSFTSVHDLWAQVLGADHEQVGTCLFRMARAQAKLGKDAEAYRLYLQARAIDEKAFNLDDPEDAETFAQTLDEYSEFLIELGRTDKAEEERAAAHALRERHKPADAPAADLAPAADGGTTDGQAP